ncbi:MAG: hypothetical protein ED556_09580, partial [Winogradskyella sp.]
MKNLTLLFKLLVVTMLVQLTSCNDAIEIAQPGRLAAANAFTNLEDLQLGVLGLYASLDSTPEI